MTNKRIIICQPKPGSSMDFTDYSWDRSCFCEGKHSRFRVFIFDKTDMQVSIDYIPKTQARKMYTFAKEQMDIVKTGAIFNNVVAEEIQFENIDSTEEIEEIETEEVTSFLKSSRFHRRVFYQRVSCLLKIRKLKRIIH
jgi:hypothetical protein